MAKKAKESNAISHAEALLAAKPFLSSDAFCIQSLPCDRFF
jgi:hypothetical protein